MADEFFQALVDGIAGEGRKHPGQTIRPEVLADFMKNTAPVVSPPGAGGAAAEASREKTVRPMASRPALQPRPAGGARPQPRMPETSFVPPEPVPARPPRPAIADLPLEELREVALQCHGCLLAKSRHHVVFGEGDPQARLMFIGEGPGGDEDRLGRPFVGRAGQLLDKMIAAMQFTREEVYIANVVKCRPPGNRVPTPDEAVACIGYLKRQIELIQPEVIVLLGATAVNFLLGRTEGITRLRGKWLAFNGIPVMPTFHPAYLLRQESAKREAWQDLQQVMKVFGKVHHR